MSGLTPLQVHPALAAHCPHGCLLAARCGAGTCTCWYLQPHCLEVSSRLTCPPFSPRPPPLQFSFAGWVVLMTIFIIFFLPETKGIPVERIHVSSLLPV